jgi:coenzyme F420-reducing hydrogenase alpha subunit
MKTRTIRVNYLARVEGEGGLYVKIRDNTVVDVKLKIFEPPRFFEAFLRGRSCEEAPDITSRICGICPIAYQMSAIHAIEDALGLKADGQLRALRRLAYCGEWIQSHALHVYLLHAPDFLGYPDAIQMARDHPGLVQRGLQLKKVGNEIIRTLGGREVHPINMRVGGFYKAPPKTLLRALIEQLKWSREAALETIRWVASMPVLDFEQDFVFVGLRHENEYPFNEGRIVSSRGLDIGVHDFEQHFTEEHISYSTALHSALDGQGGYLVGPLARYNLNFDRLSPLAQEAALAAGLQRVCRNPFQSIVVRSIEILQACDEALRLIDQYELPETPAMEVRLKAGTGYGCTEAPRGILYHRYRFDEQGTILDAKIIPPTSQNQKAIEDDLKKFVSRNVALPDEDLRGRCEQVVRNYDPCISCSTHFLKLRIDRI